MIQHRFGRFEPDGIRAGGFVFDKHFAPGFAVGEGGHNPLMIHHPGVVMEEREFIYNIYGMTFSIKIAISSPPEPWLLNLANLKK